MNKIKEKDRIFYDKDRKYQKKDKDNQIKRNQK
jgi:hypothetical protein